MVNVAMIQQLFWVWVDECLQHTLSAGATELAHNANAGPCTGNGNLAFANRTSEAQRPAQREREGERQAGVRSRADRAELAELRFFYLQACANPDTLGLPRRALLEPHLASIQRSALG